MRKKSATSTERLPLTTARVVGFSDALRAARRVEAADAGDQRKDQAEHRRLDEAGDDVVAHVEELEGVLEVAHGIGPEQLHGHEVPARDPDRVAHDHEQGQHEDRRRDPRHHEVLHGLGAERRQGVDLLRDPHRSELGRHGASHASGDHQGGKNGRELARERQGDDASDEALGVETGEPVHGLECHHRSREERREKDDGDRIDPHADHLPEELRHVVRRADGPSDDTRPSVWNTRPNSSVMRRTTVPIASRNFMDGTYGGRASRSRRGSRTDSFPRPGRDPRRGSPQRPTGPG